MSSSYAKYDPIQKEKTKTNDTGMLHPPLPDKKYSIIYADPCWDYNNKTQFDSHSGNSKNNPNWEKNYFLSAAEFKYPTMKLDDLKSIPIPDICHNDALLFMWVTSPHLPQGLELMQAWGFEYKTIAFVWNKKNKDGLTNAHNPGHYTLSNVEIVILGKRGRIPTPRGSRKEKQLISAPRMEHSVKPDEVRESIEKMFPHHDRIELFARSNHSGWDAWGLESPKQSNLFE